MRHPGSGLPRRCHSVAYGPDADRCGTSRNNAAIAAQASTKAERVKPAFHTVLTVHGATPAQRAVVMALADIGVMPTPSPQLSMNAKASTAGGTPSAAGSGTAAPSSAMTAT